ncbi:hypothetical protein JB92DRAFT_2785931, partial [Gautieria morchelliformis]
MAFNGPLAHLQACPYCGTNRYDEPEFERSNGMTWKPVLTFHTIPLGPQLQALWRNPETARLMKHRREKTRDILRQLARDGTSIGTYDDLYHGSDYLNAVIREDLKDINIAVMLSIDRAQLYQDKESDCWMYIWIILDLA